MATSKRKGASGDAKETIAFRLSPALMQELIRRAEEERISPDKLAARYVTEALSGVWQQSMTDELGLLRADIRTLRENLATATAALLVFAGREKDAASARTWAERNLLQ